MRRRHSGTRGVRGRARLSLEHGVIDGACERIYPTRLLPVQVSAALGLPASRDGEGSSWDDERDACARRLRAPDEVNALGFREPRVQSVNDVPVTLRGEISAAAQARIAFDGAEPTLVTLVEFCGAAGGDDLLSARTDNVTPGNYRVLKPAVAVLGGGLVTAALWWRRHPSACPYGQRFWVEAPHPFITRTRLREALLPESGETLLEVGPGTGYYTVEVARWLMPSGTLHVFDLQRAMLKHTTRRAAEKGVTNLEPAQGDARSLPYPDASFDGAYLVAVLRRDPGPGKRSSGIAPRDQAAWTSCCR